MVPAARALGPKKIAWSLRAQAGADAKAFMKPVITPPAMKPKATMDLPRCWGNETKKKQGETK